MTWKSLLSTAGNKQTLARAHSALGHKTLYKLGEGGQDPLQSITLTCDCSGYVAWCIGIPRELPPGSGHWLNTDCIWGGGAPVKAGLFTEIPFSESLAGDLLVYPDEGAGHYGHVGIIGQVTDRLPTMVYHCSHGNYLHHGSAIRLTTAGVFLAGNHPTRAMRVNYDLLKSVQW